MRNELQLAMPRAYVAARRWLGDSDESRDACQEAAVKAWAARGRFDSSRPFYPWFYRIVRTVCMDRLRARPRQTELRQEVVASQESAEHALIEQQRHAAVHEAIAGLPDAMREIIELRHFQDLAYEEIAAVLQCPVGTVMSRLYRARKALSSALADNPAAGEVHDG